MATGTLTDEAQEKLNGFRAEIDALDNELIARLKRRIEIVSEVGKLKRSDDTLQCFIRSGREADMLRDIYKQFEGSKFHPEAAVAIWRQIISASTQHESQMRLITPEERQTVAKTYFGQFMPISYIDDARDALKILADNPTGILIMPPWEEDSYYWQIFAQKAPPTLKVFGILPFIGSERQAFAAANLMPEPSRDDISLFIDDSGTIEEVDGYHTHYPVADGSINSHKQWLGTYGRPIGVSKDD
ncbi:MAG: chorismate mutase [Rickettsiales bacterium]|nr:chorismate mutase [Rickettsiales bacterium]